MNLDGYEEHPAGLSWANEEGNALLAECKRQREEIAALRDALAGLFEHCAMVHKHWGEGSNSKEADAAIAAAPRRARRV